MSRIGQRRLYRIGIVLAASLVVVLLAIALSPNVAARSGAAASAPHLEVDLGMPMEPPQANATQTAPPAPRPTAADPSPPADDAMTLRRVLQIEGPFRHGDYVWDDAGVPAGEIIITIDVEAETMAVFRGGYQIGAAVIIYGADDKPTPLGTFRISQKKVHHISNLYGAPMPYMMRLTDDGVAIHASEVEWGNATHGCIGVPLAFAKLLFAQAGLGTRVIVTAGKMMAVPQDAQTSAATLHH
jgi:lipoprotein-anchoring transpeptidase ErfK/SrfK